MPAHLLMRPPDEDLPNRRPVWIAWSDLYLDNELSPGDLEYLAERLAASPYSADELRYILLVEVHPACAGNLRQVAGIWSGFDADWLQQAILSRQRRRLRWPARLIPPRRSILAMATPLFLRVGALRRAN
jgi:hypothetical protein